MANVKISSKFITVNGKRAAVRYSVGPWIDGISPDLIKIRPKNGSFPVEFRAAFTLENNSDGREDYFETDQIRVLPAHPMYNEIKEAAQ